MTAIINTERRRFLKVSAATAGSLTLGIYLGTAQAETNAVAGPGEAGSTTLKEGLFEPGAFIRIDADNTVTVIIKHLEMGQGSHTGLATLVAEELDADWAQIRTEDAPADASRYNNLAFGPMQGTGGSTAMANSFLQMRQAGAAARQMLVEAAAEQWGVPVAEITVAAGVVSHAGSGQQANFGELAAAAQQREVPEEVTLKSPEQFVYIGKPNLKRVDVEAKVNGSATYTQDVQLPDMLTAVVLHPPLFGAKVVSVDAKAARELKGVVDVVQIPSGMAVLAQDFWSAKQGRDALKVEWDESQADKLDSEAQLQRYKRLADEPGVVTLQNGAAAEQLEKAAKTVQAEYAFPYLAHAAMEPMNCVVQITEGACEIWNGDQLQTIDQMAVAQLLDLTPDKVKINTLYAGGSFGRRGNSKADYVLEAAQIAKASGRSVPIKMVWTRENDMQGGYYRPFFYHRLSAGLDEQGNLLAWTQRIVGQSIMSGTPMEAMMTEGYDPSSVEGAAKPYSLSHVTVDLHTVSDLQVPVLWWRSVGHTHTAYATETFMDELAQAAGKDPVDFRRALLQDHPRHLNVLNLAAEKANWGSDLGEGRGRGIALVESFNTYVAEVAEVTVQEDGSFSVDKIILAVDCGMPVNPDVIYAQMGGGVGFALSAALGEKITFKEGRVQQSNFHNYNVLRMNQMPAVEVHIVPSLENPSGVGEPAVPPLAPALANALFAATGKRIYELPVGTSV